MNCHLPIDPDEDDRLDDLPKPIIMAIIIIGVIIASVLTNLFIR